MKKQFASIAAGFALITLLFAACSSSSTSAEEPEDTFDAAIVCPVQGVNAYGEPNRGTFTDARDGQVYKYTTIGNQVWMAENLKFDAPYSLCYERTEGFCDTFGRFYSLHVDGEYFGPFDQALVDTICPAGWHVPSVDEWNVLFNSMGGIEKGGYRLRSEENFDNRYKVGSNDCRFSALPAGYWLLDGSLSGEYVMSIYWTSSSQAMTVAYAYIIGSRTSSIVINQPKMTIRCIKD